MRVRPGRTPISRPFEWKLCCRCVVVVVVVVGVDVGGDVIV